MLCPGHYGDLRQEIPDVSVELTVPNLLQGDQTEHSGKARGGGSAFMCPMTGTIIGVNEAKADYKRKL